MTEPTDWDAYYRKTPGYTQVTRKLTTNKLKRTLQSVLPETGGLTVCELGGANSCCMNAIVDHFAVQHYHVVDANAYGLKLLDQHNPQCQLTSELADVRDPSDSAMQYDLVYSIGLIEHFDRAGTADVVRAHFDRCRAGGHVLVTFPTPTLPYRTIRSLAETTNKWSFPDERPLQFGEVEDACRAHGTIVHRSINWLIGLTQGYLVVRKAAAQ